MGDLYIADRVFDYTPGDQDFKTSHEALQILENFDVAFAIGSECAIVTEKDFGAYKILVSRCNQIIDKLETKSEAIFIEHLENRLSILNWWFTSKKRIDDFIKMQSKINPQSEYEQGWIAAIETFARMLSVNLKESE